MLAEATLLCAHEGKSGHFVRWLEKLGLADFLREYPLATLVDWGWVVPQYRVPFPRRFFEEWEDYPFYPWEPPADLNAYAVLWGYSWDLEPEDNPLWFLDPVFHPDDPAGTLLRQYDFRSKAPSIPETFQHARGITITPFVDYFYRWQGYALVDLIRHSDNIQRVYSTPDVVQRAEGTLRIAKHVIANLPDWPKAILSAPNRWGGLAPVFTWLDHYKAFQDALHCQYNLNEGKRHDLHVKGSKALADYLGLTSDMLATGIKDHLLLLAQEWMSLNERFGRGCVWTMRALPHLRADIQRGMVWLIALTGKTFAEYDAEWRRPFMGNWGWAPLDEALPYDWVRHQKKFVSLVPHYLKRFNEVVGKETCYEGESLGQLVQRLQQENHAFGGFLSAFHELHDHLSHRPFDKHGLDFRHRRPLDHFALLAIHAEGCLRRELDQLNLLEQIPNEYQGLSRYIRELAQVRRISVRAIGSFSSNKGIADLKTDRNDPIGRIMSLETKLPKKEHHIVHAFLSCLLARNYFAHHNFLDNELLFTNRAEFMLTGILLTVLLLLDSESRSVSGTMV